MTICHEASLCNTDPRCKYIIPNIEPLENIIMSSETLARIYEYKQRGWAIGQEFPNGGPDAFTYFFSIRGLPIYNYLRSSTLSIGNSSAYDKNIKTLTEYINYNIALEVKKIDVQIRKIRIYQSRNWAIGESYPNPGPDAFVVFFANRNLPIAAYLRGTVDIGDPTAYEVNIKTLEEYKQTVLSYLITI